MNKKSILYGTGVLTLGAVVVRVLGALYRIPLTRLLGSVGMGMYQMVFPIYALLIVISTSGMPNAVSKMIASCHGNHFVKKRIIKRCLLGIFIFSFVLSAILMIFCTQLAIFQENPSLSVSYLAIAPAIIFVGIISVFRGYFQGERNYLPTAVSQIVEQIVKIAVGLILAYTLKRYGIGYAVMGAIIGVSVSEFCACIVLALKYKKEQIVEIGQVVSSTQYLSVFKTILPILLCSVLLPLANVVDSFIVVRILKRYFMSNVATALYGIESGAVHGEIHE